MVEELAARVERGTVLDERYLTHASHLSMAVYLRDWRQARDRLDRQIVALQKAHDERKTMTQAGLWPSPSAASETCEQCGRDLDEHTSAQAYRCMEAAALRQVHNAAPACEGEAS